MKHIVLAVAASDAYRNLPKANIFLLHAYINAFRITLKNFNGLLSDNFGKFIMKLSFFFKVGFECWLYFLLALAS
jgi:hypothetical protein